MPIRGYLTQEEAGQVWKRMVESKWPRSRASDPETSHDAERYMRVSGTLAAQQWEVLWNVRDKPGQTAREYDSDDIFPGGVYHRRLVELERKGLVRRGTVRRCRVGGRNAATWYPTSQR